MHLVIHEYYMITMDTKMRLSFVQKLISNYTDLEFYRTSKTVKRFNVSLRLFTTSGYSQDKNETLEMSPNNC